MFARKMFARKMFARKMFASEILLSPLPFVLCYSSLMKLRFLLSLFAALLLASPPSIARAQRVASVVMLGDSITAGLGLPPSQALPLVLERELQKQNCKLSIANHGISGDTTVGGASRIASILREQPQVVIVALGANDALRGLDPRISQRALASIITTLRANKIKPILVGMKAIRNWGEEYAEDFDKIFPTVAKDFNIPFHPFLLEGVAMNAAMNQKDGLHPNAKGVLLIAQNLAASLRPHLPCE